MVHIAVADRGEGIPADEIERVVQRFVRGRNATSGGSGLGLALVKHAVEAHGGKVAVESQPGLGSTFTLLIPTS